MAFDRTRVTKDSPQSIPSGRDRRITWDNAPVNTGGWADLDDDRIQVDVDGLFLIIGRGELEQTNAASGEVAFFLADSGGSDMGGFVQAMVNGSGEVQNVATITESLSAGDVVQWRCFQRTGSSQEATADPEEMQLEVLQLA